MPGKVNNEKTTMRGENPAGNVLHGVSHLEHKEQPLYTLQKPRRDEHWAEDAGGNRAYSAGAVEARKVRVDQTKPDVLRVASRVSFL